MPPRTARTLVAILAILIIGGLPSVADDAGNVAISPYRDDQCGALCLYIALRALDIDVAGVEEVTARMGAPPEGGYSLAQLAQTAEAYGMQTRGVETSTNNLSRRPGRFACIAHFTEGHFVNLINVEQGQVHLIDAPGSSRVPIETFDSVWSRKALLISPEPIIAEEDLPIEWHWGRIAIISTILLLAILAIFLWPRLQRQAPAVE